MVFGKILNLLWQLIMVLGNFFTLVNGQMSSIYWLRILSVGDIENFHRREGVKLAEKQRGWRARSLRSLPSLLSSVAESTIALMYLRGGLLSKKQTLTIG